MNDLERGPTADHFTPMIDAACCANCSWFQRRLDGRSCCFNWLGVEKQQTNSKPVTNYKGTPIYRTIRAMGGGSCCGNHLRRAVPDGR